MGYISMVPQYEYEQYKLRGTTYAKRRHPVPVMSTRKLDLHSKLERNLEDRMVELNTRPRKKSKSIESQQREIPLSLLAELTGKGQNFHEYV
ncbi:hypothetical protein [Bacillus sp. FJAT-50079]|uniref:hypothetical protein n=1 Tax=Bacillus sp. FJAT-50079 TaxID=2833577 RepID=UPI001BC907B5|nr:hypothetical protein [Bacillus sp. FJAT-50079]MBS4207936.1 hypothetical protein [Bacillus sp. FJAT-50079]